MSKIANAHGITLAELLDANPQYKAQTDLISVGDILHVPDLPDSQHQQNDRWLGKLSEKYETGGWGLGQYPAEKGILEEFPMAPIR